MFFYILYIHELIKRLCGCRDSRLKDGIRNPQIQNPRTELCDVDGLTQTHSLMRTEFSRVEFYQSNERTTRTHSFRNRKSRFQPHDIPSPHHPHQSSLSHLFFLPSHRKLILFSESRKRQPGLSNTITTSSSGNRANENNQQTID